MLAIFIATFMTSVETTIVTTALPTIISQLNGLAMQSWVFAMYLFTTAVSTPIYGKLADRIGRKPIFISGLLVFSMGSFLCGIATNIYGLILFRAIQGIGAGAIMPITFTIIADLFTYDKRSNMIALNNTAWGISALMGPLIGGFIVDQLNWHWIFFINVPLGLLVIGLVLFGLKEKRRTHEHLPIDYLGISLLSASLITLLLLLQFLGAQQLQAIKLSFLIILLGLLVSLFYMTEKRALDPVIPLNLFKNQVFMIQILTALLLSGVQIGVQTYLPLWLQSVYRVSASIAGLAITPSSIMWLVSSFFVGFLIKKYRPQQITIPVILAMFLAYLPLTLMTKNSSIGWFYLITGISGAGLGIIITMNTLISQRVVSTEDIGVASAMLTLGRTLGQTLMTGVFGLVFNRTLKRVILSHQHLNFAQMNQFISSHNQMHFSQSYLQTLTAIVTNGMHAVFKTALLLFLIILIISLFDRQKTPIK